MPRFIPIEDLTTSHDIEDTDLVPVFDGESSVAVEAAKFKSYSTDRAEAAADAAEAAQEAAEAAAAHLVIDDTLSVEGAAADSATTGNAVNLASKIRDFVPFMYENGDVSATITVGQRVNLNGTTQEDSSYNIATFTTQADKIYKVTYRAGSSYFRIRGIELGENYLVPEGSDTYTKYIQNYAGTVRVSYRAVDQNSFSAAELWGNSMEYWQSPVSFGIADMPERCWTYCNTSQVFTDAPAELAGTSLTIEKTPMMHNSYRSLVHLYLYGKTSGFWLGAYVKNTDTVTWEYYHAQNLGILPDSSDLNDTPDGLWNLIEDNIYIHAPANHMGLLEVYTVGDNRYQVLYERSGGGIYVRSSSSTIWCEWFLAPNKGDVYVDRGDSGYSRNPAAEEVTVEITEGHQVTAYGVVEATGYNVAEFQVQADKLYLVTARNGEAWANYYQVALVEDNVNIGSVNAGGDGTYRYVIHGYTGTVQVSYRAVDQSSFSVTEAIADTRTSVLENISVWREHWYINASGEAMPTQYEISISEPIELNAGDEITCRMYALTTTAAMSITDAGMTFFEPISMGTGDHSLLSYSYTAAKHMFVCLCGFKSGAFDVTLLKKPGTTIQPEVRWGMNVIIDKGGRLGNTNTPGFRLSEPIPVLPGDKVTITGYLSAYTALAWTPQREIATYQGIPSYLPLVTDVSSASVESTRTAMATRAGYVVVSLNTAHPYSVTITRTHDSQAEADTLAMLEAAKYGEGKHNYVDEYDFAPNLEKKRINSILTYEGDTKSSENFIVNAVAYPSGEIIACRAGSGQVVRIDNDGTETVLLTIPNAQDWRGMYMDSRLNVYVSPHSSTFSPSIAKTNRGLYRLAYGADRFEKVLSLYDDTVRVIPQWTAGSSYQVGNVVFHLASFWQCSTVHTAGESFDPANWEDIPNWTANADYSAGDIVRYGADWFVRRESGNSGESFNHADWIPATACMSNDDTIWTMCEDDKGVLYAGVYAHSVRRNPAVYCSQDGGMTWYYQFNFITGGTLPLEKYNDTPRHVHCINFNNYDNCLYAAVGEVNTVCRSTNNGQSWENMETPCFYGQPTYVLGVKDGLVIGSDGHYSCGVSKIMTDGKTIKRCGRVAPGFIFNIRRSDLTGWLYAFTRIDNYVQEPARCPTPDCIDDPEALENWKTNVANAYQLKLWTDYNAWASKYYPEDAIRPQTVVMMLSRDDGDTWEVFRTDKVADNYASICGYITAGYFRDGECLVGLLKPIEGTEDGKAFVNPVIISEGKKKRTAAGFDLSGEIFIKTNTDEIIEYAV